MKSIVGIISGVVFLGILCLSCKKEEAETPPETPAPVVAETSATYTLTFEGNWSLTYHPTDDPSNSHFSPPIGLVHNNKTELIRLDTAATEGIKVMAETGKNIPLDAELKNIVATDVASFLIESEAGIGSGTGTWTSEIEVSTDYHLVSLVSMIAPSPDWFVGISNVELYKDGKFVEELTVYTKVYDAGTDSGESFASPDSATSPVANVSLFVDVPVGNGTEVQIPFAKVTLKKK